MDYASLSLKKHYEWAGKIDYSPKMEIKNSDDLSIAYTPGVAQPCLEIQNDPQKSFELTSRGNLVAVVTDGSAVLGLGDIGPEAAMPVMEGKCVLFKALGGVDALPLCLRTQDTDEFVRAVTLLAGSFGGINLEDISAPRCFEIESKLKKSCDIPVFHDDQHGTAVVTLAALVNALEIVGKRMEDIRVAVSGAGAAGIAVVKLLMSVGLRHAVLCDREGAIYAGREGLSDSKKEISIMTNPENLRGSLANAIADADVFIGVSAPGMVTEDMVRSMAKSPILFPMANPVPEIMPESAIRAGAAIVGTGRSDYPNQINNVLAFPGIFRGTFDSRASDINDKMKIAAAMALAKIARDDGLRPDYIIPAPLDGRVVPAVAEAVAKAAYESGAAMEAS